MRWIDHAKLLHGRNPPTGHQADWLYHCRRIGLGYVKPLADLGRMACMDQAERWRAAILGKRPEMALSSQDGSLGTLPTYIKFETESFAMTYDDWKLSGPDEHPEPEMIECAHCGGIDWWSDDTGTRYHICGGSGEVPVEHEEPDPDYFYERRRDAAMDRGGRDEMATN